jgi:lysine 2,3-aminomutase
MLREFQPIWINTHFNCREEITPEARLATSRIVDGGIPLGNQTVLLRGINDSREALESLFRGLVRMRVRPYYLFHPHRIAGTSHLRVSVERGLELMRGLRGTLSGFAIPQFVVDTRAGKIPLLPNYLLGRDGEDYLFENNRGEIWREKIDSR